MRRVKRLDLDHDVQADLSARQTVADRKRQEGTLNTLAEWKGARQTAGIKAVLATLQRMMGDYQRCMYCLDSHGTDIEHFWPKEPFPEKLFVWPNMLLCCTECGRFKRDRFPLADGQPLLIDPTVDDPWQYLDFDPLTGNIVARFDQCENDYSQKGAKTVEVLHLDQREAMAAGYQRTFRRLACAINEAMQEESPSGERLAKSLCQADDHGLLGWCFCGSGRNESPFREFRDTRPAVWDACRQVLGL